jgi:hypothetical protein
MKFKTICLFLMFGICAVGNAQNELSIDTSAKIVLLRDTNECNLTPNYSIRYENYHTTVSDILVKVTDTNGVKELYTLIHQHTTNAIKQLNDKDKEMSGYYQWLLSEDKVKKIIEDLVELAKFTKDPYPQKDINVTINNSSIDCLYDGLLHAKSTHLSGKSIQWLRKPDADEKKFSEAIIYRRSLKAQFLQRYLENMKITPYDRYDIKNMSANYDSMLVRWNALNTRIADLATEVSKIGKIEIDVPVGKKYKDSMSIEAFLKKYTGKDKVKKEGVWLDLNLSKLPTLKAYIDSFKSIHKDILALEANDTLKKIKDTMKAMVNHWAWNSSTSFMNPYMELSTTTTDELKKKLVPFIQYKLKDSINFNKLSVDDYKSLLKELDIASNHTTTSILQYPFLEDTIILNQVKFPKNENETNENTIYLAFNERGKEGYWEKLLKQPIRTDEIKRMYIHNVPNEYTIKVKEAEADIVAENDIFNDSGLVSSLSSIINNASIQDMFPANNFANAKVMAQSTGTKNSPNVRDLEKILAKVVQSEKSSESSSLIQSKIPSSVLEYSRKINWSEYKQKLSKNDSLKILEEFIKNKLARLRDSKPTTKQITISFQDDLKELKRSLNFDNILLAHYAEYLKSDMIKKESHLAWRPAVSSPLATHYIETTPVSNEKEVTLALWKYKDKDSSIYRKVKYKVGKPQLFGISIGGAFSTGATYNYEVLSTDSTLKITNNTPPLRLIAGLHLYPRKHFLYDQSLLAIRSGKYLERLSLYGGLHVSKKPFDNFYLGVSYDIIPGIKFITGVHNTRNDTYDIINNKVRDKKIHYSSNFFISLSISPGSTFNNLISLIGLL